LKGKKVIQITVIVNRELSETLFEALKDIGVHYITLMPCRRIFLQEKHGIMKMLGVEKSIMDIPMNILTFLITPDKEQLILNHIIIKGELDIPGRGCIFSTELNLLNAHAECQENIINNFTAERKNLLTDLKGIYCVVQKGEGNRVGRVGLDTGTGSPAITFGEGTGFRDKLGIWRITIPAEKEIINLITTSHDADQVMDMMIDIGSLDQPGKGFISLYPVRMGLINTKIFIGMISQPASIEQIVSVLDEMKGSTGWRRREFAVPSSERTRSAQIDQLVTLTVTCDEGKSEELIKAAKSAGASGATTSKCRHMLLNDSAASTVSPARESSTLVISEKYIEGILSALEKNGAFEDTIHAQVLSGQTIKICTYSG
jgi:nitrogen regulatory protein PII